MQSVSFLHDRPIFKPVIPGLLLLLLLAASILFTPRSEAIHPDPSQAQAERPVRSVIAQFVPGEVLVRFKQGRAFEGPAMVAVPSNDVALQAQQKTGSHALAMSNEEIQVNLDRFAGSDLVEGLRLARVAPDDTIKALAALSARGDVLYAEPNYILHTDKTPNMTKIGAPTAWNTTTGSTNIVVGIIDEGIDISHPDLAANIWTNPVPGSIPGISGDVHGYDFINNSGTIPPEKHATHVAGTIGAVGNNGVGVVGVNWQVNLMSLRFIDQATNNGSTADAIRAYNYAKQMRDLFVSSGDKRRQHPRFECELWRRRFFES